MFQTLFPTEDTFHRDLNRPLVLDYALERYKLFNRTLKPSKSIITFTLIPHHPTNQGLHHKSEWPREFFILQIEKIIKINNKKITTIKICYGVLEHLL